MILTIKIPQANLQKTKTKLQQWLIDWLWWTLSRQCASESHVFSRTSLPKLTRSLRESENAGWAQGHLVEYIWGDLRFKTGNARVFVDDIYKQTKVTTKVTALSSRDWVWSEGSRWIPESKTASSKGSSPIGPDMFNYWSSVYLASLCDLTRAWLTRRLSTLTSLAMHQLY